MCRLLDLTGKKFNRLTVIKRVENSSCGKVQWLCKCDCGNEVIVVSSCLKNGHTKSCGCLQKEKSSKINYKHNLANSRIYHTWLNIKTRCYNKNVWNYKNYGQRGIKMCDEWRNDFKTFYDWSIKNGYKDDLTIDRINVNGNYEPNNCRWVDRFIQQRNTTRNHYITYNNETHCLVEWSEILNIKYGILRDRINKLHWSVEKAFTTEKQRHYLL